MTPRPHGDGGLHWDERRQRWIATTTVGFDGRGKRLVRKASGRTKTEAKVKLRELLRGREDGVAPVQDRYTVAQAVEDWLSRGLSNRDAATRKANRHLCEKHLLPQLGARKLRDLSAAEVDTWLMTRAAVLVCVPGSGVVPELACRVLPGDGGGHRATVSETGLGNSQEDTMHDGLGPCCPTRRVGDDEDRRGR
jgi:hypothetical protein